MRPAETKDDERFELASHLDFFFERYGWTLDEYLSNPRWLVEMLPVVVDIRRTVAQRQQRAEAAKISAKD